MTRARRKQRSSDSLGAKLVLILTGVGLVGSLAIALLLSAIITPSFDRLEKGSIGGHVERTRAALRDFSWKVETAARDYGDWNSSYEYMRRPTRAFEEESFSRLAMANLDISGMAYVADSHAVIARWVDATAGNDDADMRSRLIAAIPAMKLRERLARDNAASFYIRLGDRLIAVGVARVRRSDGTGTPRGQVLMARELTPRQLSRLLQLPARLDVGADVATPAVTTDQNMVHIAVPVLGADGGSVASARFAVPRELTWLGHRMLFFAVGGAVLLLALVLIVLRRMIWRMVLRPLRRVEHHMGVVRQSGQLIPLPTDRRSDEIGNLVTSFNSMLHQLNDLHERLEVQSFKLGQSESAVAVMHNVRNALNPISTILSQGIDRPGAADRSLVTRAIAELADDDIPCARRRKLAAFVAAATEADDAERAERQRGIEMGREALRNVLDIIGHQQREAHGRPPLAACNLTDIVAQNATIARYSGEVSPAFIFPSRPHWALANRVVLSQVVGNLLANAGEAIAAAGRGGGAINVAITERDGIVELTIQDDGEGFDPGLAPRFFQRGYSTRHEKSGGLGLHWCANAMGTMSGSLSLTSAGRGMGATATLTLPIAPSTATELAA